MGIYLNDIPTYGWAKKGEKCEIESKSNVSQKRVSLIVAMNNKKIIKYKLYEQNVTGDKYLQFIKEINYKNKGKYMLMVKIDKLSLSIFSVGICLQQIPSDNATIHHTKKLKEYIKKKNINVIYNLPYCPEFNPIENVNSMIRNNVLYGKNSTIGDIENVLKEFKNKNHKIEFQNIYNSTFQRLKS